MIIFSFNFSIRSSIADNIAFDAVIRNVSGVDAMAAKYGPYYTTAGSPRNQIFKRSLPDITE